MTIRVRRIPSLGENEKRRPLAIPVYLVAKIPFTGTHNSLATQGIACYIGIETERSSIGSAPGELQDIHNENAALECGVLLLEELCEMPALRRF